MFVLALPWARRPHRRTGVRRRLALISALAAAIALTVVSGSGGPAAAATPTGPAPVIQRPAGAVTADALPTEQIDGVAWSQAIVGSTVYVGGSFANARPAGAAPGTNLTPRANLLAYDITTGALDAAFDPSPNGQVEAVTTSPDGSVLYVGGLFTTAGGQARSRVAAFSTATGALLTTFAPKLDAAVYAITATATTVYVGGAFSTANGQPRSRLAAFSAATGALLPWTAAANADVRALAVTPDGSRVVVGGRFTTLASVGALGMGALDATTGAVLPWAATSVVHDSGTQSAILSLSVNSTGTEIIGTGYNYTGGGGNFEGSFAADPTTGALVWMEDCHGDSYDAASANGLVYVVSHTHYCGNDGGFGDYVAPSKWYHTTAFTDAATGTLAPNAIGGYANFAGQPSPTLVNWFPTLTDGTYTGLSQAAWSVAANANYVVEGGEFPTVNGTAQQGLVRFAIPSLAPNKVAPAFSVPTYPTVVYGAGTATVSWQPTYDIDDLNLTYTLYRDGTKLYSTIGSAPFWNEQPMTYTDTGLAPGYQPDYRLIVSDPSGNSFTYDEYYDDTDPRWSYAGAWTSGSVAGDWNGGDHTTTTVGSSATFSFTGVGVTPVYDLGPSGGTATVSIDGRLVATVNTASATARGRASLGGYGGLANTTHTVTITFTGGTQLGLDALQYNGSGVTATTTTTLVNDTGSALSYQSTSSTGWIYSANRNVGDYQNDVHASRTIGDTATLTFLGTAATIYGETYSDQGTVGVTIDGVARPSVSTVSTTRGAQVPIVAVTGLAPGLHTIVLTHLSGTWMTIDKAVWVGPVGAPVPTTVNDSNAALAYRATSSTGWIYSANRNVGDYQNDVHASRTVGDSVTLTFTGTSAAVYGETYSDQGTVGVTVDGVPWPSVSTVSTTRGAQVPIVTDTGLAPGPHTIVLTHLSGTWMTIDKAIWA